MGANNAKLQAEANVRRERVIELAEEAGRPITVALVGEVGSGKSAAVNTIHRVMTQRRSETVAEYGCTGRTTCHVRRYAVRARTAAGSSVCVFRLLDFPGVSLSTQMDQRFVEAVMRGVRAGTGAPTSEEMLSAITCPDNADPANAPDMIVFVLDPIAYQSDRSFLQRVLGRGAEVDGANAAARLSVTFEQAAETRHPMVLVTKRLHSDRRDDTTVYKIANAFRDAFPSSNFYDVENYTVPDMLIVDTELEVLRLLIDIQHRVYDS